MKKLFIISLVCISFASCSIDRTSTFLTKSEIETLQKFKELDSASSLRIAQLEEEGQRLWLCLTFISKENKRPLINQDVKIYHATSKGEYEPTNPRDESTARLSGSIKTNDSGQAFIQTILPGDYGSSANNRHIHTTVAKAHPVAYDIHFKQYTTVLGEGFISRSDQHFLADLKQTKDSVLVTFLTIEVKTSQHASDTTQAIPDAVVVRKRDVLEEVAGSAYLSAAYEYFVIKSGAESVNKPVFYVNKEDQTIGLDLNIPYVNDGHSFNKRLSDLQLIMKYASKDFILDSLKSISIGRLILTDQMALTVSQEYSNQFDITKKITVADYAEVESFLLHSSLDSSLNSVINRHNLQTAAYSVEKVFVSNFTELKKHGFLKKKNLDSNQPILDCIVNVSVKYDSK